MTLEIGGVARRILSIDPTAVSISGNWPDKDANGNDLIVNDAAFTIKADLRSSDGLTLAELICAKTTFAECGGYSVAVGNYAPDDLFTVENKIATKQGAPITLTCQDGYRAVSSSCPYLLVDDSEGGGKCTATQAQVDTGTGSMKRTCRGCTYESEDNKRCAPLACNASEFDIEIEELEEGTPTIIVFGEKQVVKCKRGYLVGNKADRGLAFGGSPNQYTRTCGTKDSDHTNDHIFTVETKISGPCTRVACGVFVLPTYSSVDNDNTVLVDVGKGVPTWSAMLQIVHGETIALTCNAGYRYSDSPGNMDSPCNVTMKVTCDAGEWKYDGILSKKAPLCVPLTCGNPKMDTCGNETCLASTGLGDGVNLSATPTNAPLVNGAQQVIHCAQGYRAQSILAESLGPSCNASETYSRTCGWCKFSEQSQCEMIVCNATSTNPDPNGILNSEVSRFGQSTRMTCNRGYRAAMNTDAPASVTLASPSTFDLVCNSSCSPHAAGMQCRKVACATYSIANADPKEIDELATVFGDLVEYVCKAGYKRKGTRSTLNGPCSASIFAQCDDGKFVFNTGPPLFTPVVAECEPIVGCGANSECGQETCIPHAIKDVNGQVPATTPSTDTTKPVVVTCNSGFAPAPADDRFANCNGTAGLRSDFVVPDTYDETKNEYKVNCTYCNWQPQGMSCKPLSCTVANGMVPNGKIVSAIEDVRGRILNGARVTVECNFGWRANASAFAVASDALRFEMTCAPDACTAVRALDVPESGQQLACKPVACVADSVIVPNAQTVASDGTGDAWGAGSSDDAQVIHDKIVRFQCEEGSKSIFATTCSSNEPFYGICTDGKLVFYGNDDEDPVMRGPAATDKSTICLPKKCPRLDQALHPNTQPMLAYNQAISSSIGAGKDAWDLTVNCSAGFRVGPDPVLPNGNKSYELLCKDCIWGGVEKCVDLTGYADSNGNTCDDWKAHPTWCYGSPEDGIIDLPALYANSDGIDPTTACCVCGGGGVSPENMCQKGYCPHVHYDSTQFAAIETIVQDNVLTPTSDLQTQLESGGAKPVLMKKLQNGESVGVSCKAGYRIKGKNTEDFGTVACSDTGLYPANLTAICVPLFCESFDGVPNSERDSCVTDELTARVNQCTAACGDEAHTDQTKRCSYNQCKAACTPPCYCKTDSSFKTWFDDANSLACSLICGGIDYWEYGAAVTVTCKDNFFLKGGSCGSDPALIDTARCDLNGKWSSNPVCLQVPTNKSCSFNDPNAVLPNNILGVKDRVKTIQCKPGFVAVAHSSVAVYASEDTFFQTNYTASCADCKISTGNDGDALQCLPVACPAQNWSGIYANIETWVPKDEPVNVLQGVLIICKVGYLASAPYFSQNSVIAASPTAPKSFTVACKLEGLLNPEDSPKAGYSQSQQICVPVTCGKPPKVPNAMYLGSTSDALEFTDAIQYSCREGFRIKDGDASNCTRKWTATCKHDGTFDIRDCVPVTCPVDSSPGTNLMQDIDGSEIPYNSGITYGCKFGFEIQLAAVSSTEDITTELKVFTSETRGTCQNNCRMSAHLQCIKQKCSVPPDTLSSTAGLNGATSLVASAGFAETIPITCAAGFVLQGTFFDDMCVNVFFAQCLSSRKFTLIDELKCVRAHCPNPKAFFGGAEETLIKNGVVTFDECPCACPRTDTGEEAENVVSAEEADGEVLIAPTWGWGDVLYIKCNAGYVAEEGSCLRDGNCLNCMKLQCGNGAQDGESCQWQTPRKNKCVQKNICRNYLEWPESTVTSRYVRTHMPALAIRTRMKILTHVSLQIG